MNWLNNAMLVLDIWDVQIFNFYFADFQMKRFALNWETQDMDTVPLSSF